MARISRRPRSGGGYQVEVLEPRLLLSADWIGALAPPWDDDHDFGPDRDASADMLPESLAAHRSSTAPLPDALDLNALLGLHPDVATASAADSSQRHELVVVDAGVQGYEQLVADFSARSGGGTFYEIYVLAADADGVATLSDILAGHRNLDALHIVSHGGDGAIQLGQTRLDTAGTEGYQTQLQGWSEALAENADLMIYGCDLARTADGQMLAERLGALTGADVAASTDLTGDAALGGDWDLEFTAGTIDTKVAFSAHLQTSWSSVLATFVVDTVNDTVDANPGDGVARDAAGNTSLRAAIMEANALAGADVISLPSGTYTMTIAGAGENAGFTGDLDILQQLTIVGANAADTVIDADDLDRVIDVIGAVDVSISGVTLQGGETGLTGGAINNQGGTLTLDSVSIRDNVANAGGGGIYNDGAVDLQRVTLSGNQTSGSGGAIYSTAGATMTALTNVTVSGNTASSTGGGLFFLSDADLLNVTITLNTSAAGGGGINIDLGVTTVQNTIIDDNSAPLGPDVRGTVVSDGSNIIIDASDSNGFTAPEIGVDPELDNNLRDNGGPTLTHALLADSPAINAAASAPAPAVDQRGAMRDGMPDLGAYEFGGNTPPVANNDDYAVIFDTTLVVNAAGGLLANDSDFEFDTLSLFLLTSPANGTLTLNPQGLTGLDNLTMDAAVDGFPSWSPDSSQVAFASQRDGNYNIFVMNADGTGLTQLTSSPAAELQPVWSPDGTQILFRSDAAGNFDIYVMDANGANPMRLTMGAISDGSDEYDARWSPDGSQIVYVTELGNASIWVMERDGSSQVQLTSPAASDTAPAWSPDGTRIAFVSNAAGNNDIYVMDADGSNITPLTTNLFTDGAPTWSPDGSKMLFHSDRDGDFDLYVMDADGNNVVQITDNVASDMYGAWSPKGDRIVFQTDRAGNDEIFTSIIVSDGGFTYTPNNGFNGIDSFTYQVSDGTSLSAPATVTLTVGNNAPAATNLTQSVGYLEDAASVALTDIIVTDPDAGDTITATLSLADIGAGVLTAGSGNGETYDPGTGVWTITGSVAQVNAALASVAFVPTANSNVTTTISTMIRDLAGTGPATGVITLSGTPVNDVPSFSTLGNQNVLEDSGPHTVAGFATALPGGGADEAGQTFTYSVSSDNLGLFLVAPTIDASGTLSYTLNPNVNGTARVTVSVTDSGGTANGGVDTSADQSFDIIVGAVNDVPSFTMAGNQAVLEDSGPHTVAGFANALPGGGADEGGQTFTYSVSSDNPGLFLAAPTIDASGTLSYTLNPNVNGTARVTVSVSDSGGTANGGVDTSADQSFDIIVGAVNDVPSFTMAGNQAVLEDSGPHTVAGFATALPGGGADEAGQTFTYSVSSDNPGLFLVAPTIDASGTLSYTLNPNVNGTARVTVSVTDSGGTANGGVDTSADQSFDIIVGAVNDAPIANPGEPYTISEGGQLDLDASSSNDVDADPLTFDWDLSYDGVTFNAEASGDTPSLSWLVLQGLGLGDDGVYAVAVRADDGTTTTIQQTTLTIVNVAPTITVTGAGAAVAGGTYTLALSDIDPGADTVTSWTINWGDGTIQTIVGDPASVTHTYTGAGFTYNILASATDEDGTWLQNDLLVASYDAGDGIFRFEATTGDFLQLFATADGLDDPIEAVVGPDGNLYVSGENSDTVLRYNATTGAFIDVFVAFQDGGLRSPGGLAFGPDGNLYVASYTTDEVLRYDGVSGAFIDAFVNDGSGGLNQPYGLTFGPDGNLYVGSYIHDEVLRYDATSGAFIDIFVASGAGGLSNPEQMTFGPDGNLYVASFGSDEVLRYDGTTGAFLDIFVTAGHGGLDEPAGLAFGPDGNLYVSDFNDAVILRYNGVTGAFIDEYVTAGSGGLVSPTFLEFLPQQQVSVSASSVAPTLTVFANPVETTLEDTLVEISYTDLVLAGDEFDADGNVVAFVVRNVTSGTLLIGAGAGTATPWAAGSNDTIDASTNAYWLPTAEVTGAQNAFAVVAKDDDGLESAANIAVQVAVTAVNDVPSFTTVGNQNVLEDSGPHTVAGFATALPGGGADEAGQTFTYSVSSDNPGLFLVAPTIDASGTLTYTLNPNVNGTARVTVSVTDSGGTANGGVDTSADQAFDINVGAVNDMPSLIALRNQFVQEDSGPHAVAGFATALPGGGADEAGQTFTYSVSSDNPGLFLVAPTIDASGTLSYTLNPNVNGTARVAVSVTDSGGTANGGVDTAADQSFDIIVGAVNDVPSFTMMGNQAVLEDSGPHTVAGFATALPGGGADETGQTFTYSVSSDNPGLFLVAPTIDASGTLTYTLNANVNGTARVTVSVTDSGGTANGGVDTAANQVFDINVGAVNDVPSFTMAGNQAVLEDSGPHTVAGFATALPGGGADEAGQTFTYSVSSDNPGLFLVAPTIDASGTLSYTLNPNVNGTARVAVSVTDSGGTANGGVDTAANQVFDINVGGVNDVPSFTMAGNQAVLEDSGPHTVAGFATALPGGGADEAGHTFTYSVSSDNPGLFLVAPTIDAAGTLTYTLNPNVNGTARVTVSVTDSGGTANGGMDTSANQSFDIIVGAVNDVPSFTMAGNQAVLEDSGPHTVAGFATALPGGGADEVAQTFSYSVSSDNPGLFLVAPTIDASGTLSYTLNPNVNGTARVTVSVTDSGGTANGGMDTPADQSFDIVVTPAASFPLATNLDQALVYIEDSGPVDLQDILVSVSGGSELVSATLSLADVTTGVLSADSGNGETYSAATGVWTVTGTVSQVNAALAAVTFTPTLNNDVDTVVATDVRNAAGDLAADGLITLNVVPVNDAPVGQDGLLAVLGNTTYALTLADFGFADPVEGHDWLGVRIVSLPALNATLLNNGAPVSQGDIISAADIRAGRLQLATIGNDPSDSLTSLAFQVQDTGGTLAGGQEFDATVRRLTLLVLSDRAPASEQTSIVDNASPEADDAPSVSADEADAVTNAARPAVAQPTALPGEIERIAPEPVAVNAPREASVALFPNRPESPFPTATVPAQESTIGAAQIPALAIAPNDSPNNLPSPSQDAMAEMLEQIRDAIDEDMSQSKVLVSRTTAGVVGLSVGYISWLLRGGVLLSSVLSSMPVWRFVDPLPVFMRDRRRHSDDDADESLESIVQGGSATADRDIEPSTKQPAPPAA